MKTILFILLSSLYLLNSKPSKKEISAQVTKIEYYSKGICKDSSLIYVRVLYKVSGEKVENLKMKHDFRNGIISTLPVKEVDKNGNIVYGFCLAKTEVREFSTVFITLNGSLSNRLSIRIDAANSEITQGTAPETITVGN